jgi:hypothetical protein
LRRSARRIVALRHDVQHMFILNCVGGVDYKHTAVSTLRHGAYYSTNIQSIIFKYINRKLVCSVNARIRPMVDPQDLAASAVAWTIEAQGI